MAKKTAATAVEGSVIVRVLGVTEYEGAVTENEMSVSVTHKKPRSPKMITRIIPMNEVIAFQAGEEGFVTQSGFVDYTSYYVADINTDVTFEDGWVTIVTEDGDVNFKTGPSISIEISGETAVESEAKPKAAAKGKAAPKGKAKKEESAEEESEESEEEAPKKKKAGKADKGGKAKGGKKKAAASDEWPEDE